MPQLIQIPKLTTKLNFTLICPFKSMKCFFKVCILLTKNFYSTNYTKDLYLLNYILSPYFTSFDNTLTLFAWCDKYNSFPGMKVSKR